MALIRFQCIFSARKKTIHEWVSRCWFFSASTPARTAAAAAVVQGFYMQYRVLVVPWLITAELGGICFLNTRLASVCIGFLRWRTYGLPNIHSAVRQIFPIVVLTNMQGWRVLVNYVHQHPTSCATSCKYHFRILKVVSYYIDIFHKPYYILVHIRTINVYFKYSKK